MSPRSPTDAGTTSYRYDLADNPISRTDGRGGSRHTRMTVWAGSPRRPSTGNKTTFGNDVAGQRTSAGRPGGPDDGIPARRGEPGHPRHTAKRSAPDRRRPDIATPWSRRASMTSGGVNSAARMTPAEISPAQARQTSGSPTTLNPTARCSDHPTAPMSPTTSTTPAPWAPLTGQAPTATCRVLPATPRRATAVSLAN